jgi:hypothetical protein
MEILIAKPRLDLPDRLRREMNEERRLRAWHRRAWMAIAAAALVAVLSNIALYLALHGLGTWAVLPGVLSAIPLMWLLDKAAFENAPGPVAHGMATNLPELIRTPR